MKGKTIIRNALLLILIAAVLYVGDMFLGNPISYFRVKQHARQYLEGAYPGQLQLQMDDIYYDWYSGGGYEIDVTSPVSRDTRFQLRYDRLGNFVQDTYDLLVASGSNTMSRLYTEYDKLVNDALRDVLGDNICKTGLSSMDFYSRKTVPLEYGIDPEQLTLNGDYDVKELGREYGYLMLNVQEAPENITVEKAAEHLLAVKSAMADAGVGFHSIKIFLSVRDAKDDTNCLLLDFLTCQELEQENLPEHLQKYIVH